MNVHKLLILSLFAIITQALHADITKAINCLSGFPPKWKKIEYKYTPKEKKQPENTTSVGFSFSNKYKKPVIVRVKNSSKYERSAVERALRAVVGAQTLYKVHPDSILDIELDTSKPTTLEIFECPDQVLDQCDVEKHKVYTYTFSQNKLIYVTWNPEKPKVYKDKSYKLYPQTGPLLNTDITDHCFYKGPKSNLNVGYINITKKK